MPSITAALIFSRIILFGVAAIMCQSCSKEPLTHQPQASSKKLLPPPEQNLALIKLPGIWGEAEREYSGAALWKDSVVLLPQYPERSGNQIPILPVDQLLSARATGVSPLPATIAFDDDGLSKIIEGFEGFEAITFRGDRVFVTIESESGEMLGYLVSGTFTSTNDGAGKIKLDANSRMELPARSGLSNLSDESIVIFPDGKMITLYEANGANVEPHATAHMFDISSGTIKRLKDVPMIHIEYRVTDCAPADAEGKFWCINYMFPGDQSRLNPAPDAFAERWGVSASQTAAWNAGNKLVERLIQLQFDGSQVKATDTAPIYLPIREDGAPCNWEGIVQIAGRGFFVATDKFPETLFGFVETKP